MCKHMHKSGSYKVDPYIRESHERTEWMKIDQRIGASANSDTGSRAAAPVLQLQAGVFDRLPTAPVWMKQRQSPTN
jgi:hypothetical protein